MELIYIFGDSLESGLIWAILALGVFISFRILDFADLTVEGSIVLGSSVSASLVLSNNPVFSNFFVALVVATLAGALAGMLTGFLNVKLKIPGILAGIISMTALYSINLLIMGAASLYINDAFTIYNPLELLFKNVFKISNLALVSFLTKFITNLLVNGLVFFLLYWFFGTEIGMALRATGNNKKMARAQGINTDKMVIIGLAISNALIALSGALYVQSYKSSNMDLGRGTIIVGLASIILGEILFGKTTFKRWLLAIIAGSIVFQFIIGLALMLGFSANNLKLLQAILIAIVLANPQIKVWIKSIKKKRGNKHVEN